MTDAAPAPNLLVPPMFYDYSRKSCGGCIISILKVIVENVKMVYLGYYS